MNGIKTIYSNSKQINQKCKKIKNGSKPLEFPDEIINKSLVLPYKILQISTQKTYEAEALIGSLAPLPTSIPSTWSCFFQLHVSICSTVVSLKETFKGKRN